MSLYRDRFLSLVKFCKATSAECASALSIQAPEFVNFDAHANLDTLPQRDILGITGYSIHMDDKFPTIFVGFALSTYQDKDMLRHMAIMDILFSRLEVNSTISTYRTEHPTQVDGYMIVANGPLLEPVELMDIRTLQVLNVRLLNDASAAL